MELKDKIYVIVYVSYVQYSADQIYCRSSILS